MFYFIIVLILSFPLQLYANGEDLKKILPPDAMYEENLSQDQTKRINALVEKVTGKFSGTKIDYFVFSTDSSFGEIMKWFAQKKVHLKRLEKEKELEKLKEQTGQEKNQYIKVLKDPNYQAAMGTYFDYFLEVSSYAIINGQKIDRTTIVFSISKKKEIR